MERITQAYEDIYLEICCHIVHFLREESCQHFLYLKISNGVLREPLREFEMGSLQVRDQENWEQIHAWEKEMAGRGEKESYGVSWSSRL